MRVMTREEAAPLPEAIARFGTPDPLTVLPRLENQLEAVAGSTAQVRQMAAGLRGTADDLEAEAGAVAWQGTASDRFRSKIAGVTRNFRAAADQLDTAAAEEDSAVDRIKSILDQTFKAIMVYAAVVAALLLLIAAVPLGAGAASTLSLIAAVLGVVAALYIALRAYLDEIFFVGEQLGSVLAVLVERLRELLFGSDGPEEKV